MKGWLFTAASLALFLTVAATAPASPTARTFMEGTKAFQNGDWPAAIAAFKRLADSGIDNGKLFYNIGNIYFRIGDMNGPSNAFRMTRICASTTILP